MWVHRPPEQEPFPLNRVQKERFFLKSLRWVRHPPELTGRVSEPPYINRESEFATPVQEIRDTL